MTPGAAVAAGLALPRRALVAVRVLVLVARAEWLLRRWPVGRAASAFGLRLRDGVEEVPEAAPIRLEARFVEHRRVLDRLLLRWPWADGTCLRRSLVLGWLLRDRAPRLCLGVRFDDEGELHAHAWIDVDGASIGRQDARLVDLSTS